MWAYLILVCICLRVSFLTSETNSSLVGTYTASSSTSETLARPDDSLDKHGRWVQFPKLIETCGFVSKNQLIDPSGNNCGPGCVMEPYCSGDIETIAEQCSTTPDVSADGIANVFWAWREYLFKLLNISDV